MIIGVSTFTYSGVDMSAVSEVIENCGISSADVVRAVRFRLIPYCDCVRFES